MILFLLHLLYFLHVLWKITLSLSLMHFPSPSTICWFEHLQAVYMNFRSFAHCYRSVKCSTSILMRSDSCPTLNTGRPVLSSPLVGCYTQYLQLVVSHTYQTGLIGEICRGILGQWTWSNPKRNNFSMFPPDIMLLQLLLLAPVFQIDNCCSYWLKLIVAFRNGSVRGSFLVLSFLVYEEKAH